MVYWDTSVILKLYAPEKDSREWQDLVVTRQESLRSSTLLMAELAYALKQKEMRQEIMRGAAESLYAMFKEDVSDGRFLFAPLGKDVLQAAVELAELGNWAKSPVPLRILDGLHLATARVLKCREIATSDQRLAEAAIALGMDCLRI